VVPPQRLHHRLISAAPPAQRKELASEYATLDVYIATAGTDGSFTVKEKVAALEPRLSCK
jgi:hypothetical protein